MKTKALSFCTKILSFFLILLGFQSCEKRGGRTTCCEYGVPSATFKVKGKVQDSETGKPVKDIRAVLVKMHSNTPDEKMESIYETDTVYTNAAGEFDASINSFPENNVEFKVKFADIDGDENGKYESKDIEVIFDNPKYEGKSGNWYSGETTKNIETINLESVKE